MELNIRNYFIADPGHILVFQDADAEEYRLLGHYGQDENFNQFIHDGKDIHKATASEMFHVPYEDVTDEQRGNGKTTNFGLVYGLGTPAFAKALGFKINEDIIKTATRNHLYKNWQAYEVPPYKCNKCRFTWGCPECQECIGRFANGLTGEVLDAVLYYFTDYVQEALRTAARTKKEYFAKFPGNQQFIKECSRVASERGWVKDWTGRRRHFKNPKTEGYKAPNSVIQGGCGGVIKKKMYEVRCFLRDGGYKTNMVNNVHDEITTMHPIDRRELEIIPVINKILCDLPFRVPITWGIEWGYKWGTKKDFTSLEELYKELRI